MATILIVDDETAIRQYLTQVLVEQGHRLLQAADGAEALATAQAARPDLVISDILMPTMDGFEFVHRLRADPATARTPVVFVTAAYLEQEAQLLAQACGVLRLIPKPFKRDTMLRVVAAALADRPAPPVATPEHFGHAHMRLLTNKVAAQISELETANQQLAALVEQVRNNEAFLHSLIQTAGSVILCLTPDFRIVEWNQEAERISGRLRKDVLGMHFLELCLPESLREPVAADLQGVLSGEPIRGREVRLHSADGSERWVCWNVNRLVNGAGKPSGVIAVGQDFTQRRQAEEALRASENRFQAFMDNSPTVAFIKDEEGRYLYYSGAVESGHGRTPADLIGKFDREIWPEETMQQIRANDAAVLASGRALERIETIPQEDGSLNHWLVYKFPLRESSGKLLLGGMALDVTEKKKAEQTLQDYAVRLQHLSSRLVAVQEEERRHIARELHDEIGQTLTGLRFILESKPEPVAVAAGMSEARTLVDDLMQRVRGLSRDLRPPMLDHLGLLAALHWMFQNYKEQTSIRVNLKQEGLEPRLAPDLELTVFRLVQEGLTNVARHAGVDQVSVRVWIRDRVLALQIEDQGSGFNPEEVLAAGGTAGLVGMQERVRLLHGQMTIESAPRAGTQLMIQLPLNTATTEESR